MISKQSPGEQRRVVIVDDHPIVREGLVLLMQAEPDVSVCGIAADTQTALEVLERTRPDIVIADLSLNGRDGLELVKAIRASDQQLPVLILSMHDEATYAERSLRAGANGYVMKQEATEQLLSAIRRVLAGEIYVSDRIANRILRQLASGHSGTRRSPVDGLTDRELEVFRRIGEGHSTRQIAEELHLSVKTVESHQAHLKEKLSLRTARELFQCAIEWVMVENGKLTLETTAGR